MTSNLDQAVLTLKKVIEEAKPLCVLKLEVGTGNIAAVLDWHLTALAKMMNVKHNLDSTQIRIIVGDLIDMFPGESIEDFLLCFKRLRQGYYGETYHLLNEANIIACFRRHLEEKYAELERLHNHEKKLREQQEVEAIDMHAAYERLRKEGPKPADPKRKREEEYEKFRADYLVKKYGNKTEGSNGVNNAGQPDAPNTAD